MNGLDVVHVICTDAFGGAERYVRNSALWLARAGCRVAVIGGAETAMRPTLEEAGVRWLPGADARQALRSMQWVGRPDILNTHMTTADAVGVLAASTLHRPVVSTRHFASTRGSSLVARLAARGISARVAGQLAISDFVASRVEGASVTVRSGVEPAAPVTAARNPVVLVAQRLEPEKSTAVALEAWAQLGAQAAAGWRLAIAGDGSLRESLEQRARALGIAHSVDFLGHRSDIEELFRSSSILLAPTPAEGLGLSVVEAMAHGLPVVAAASGGHLETVGTVPGAALFAPADAAGAARELARLMSNDDERAAYGAALRAHQRAALTADSQTEGTLRLYRQVVSEK